MSGGRPARGSARGRGERLIYLDKWSRGDAATLWLDGRLDDVLLSIRADAAAPAPVAPGMIALGRVSRVVPEMKAVFVDLGGGLRGFAEGLTATEGEIRVVEISRLAEAGKAWPLAKLPSLRSRRVALTPGAPGINVSRALKGAAMRAAAQAAVTRGLAALDLSVIGAVIRTAAGERAPTPPTAVGAPEIDVCGLEAEASALARLWLDFDNAATRDLSPRTLASAPSASALALREWTAGLGGDARLWASARWFDLGGFEGLAPSIATADPIRQRVARAPDGLVEGLDLFSALRAPHAARWPLDAARGASGGWIAVTETAAVTAVDVNSGVEAGRSAGVVDVAAAREIPRLLRLRGLGGLVVVDFISKGREERDRVTDALQAALRADPTPTEILGWTAGGLLELRRKRARAPIPLDALTLWEQSSTPGGEGDRHDTRRRP